MMHRDLEFERRSLDVSTWSSLSHCQQGATASLPSQQLVALCDWLQALRAAMELEPLLLGPITAAAAGCQHPATRRTLGESLAACLNSYWHYAGTE
jgi:hypothetical protein